jgi:hypothetical protein
MDDKVNILISKILIIQQGDYRVNDVISKRGERWQYSGNNVLKKDKYNGTILKKYITINGLHKQKNLKTLLSIVKDNNTTNNFVNPTENELVMHLRLGDYEMKKDFLKKNYVKNIKLFLDKYPNIDKLTIVTAFSYGTWSNDSLHLRKCAPLWMCTKKTQEHNKSSVSNIFKEIFESFPLLVIDIKSSKNIDEDFCYCIMSNYFIEDVGGFSRLIYKLNNLRLREKNALNFTVEK